MTRNTRDGLYMAFKANDRPEINEVQADALDDVRQVSRCRTDLETWRAHQAVFSKVEEMIDAEGNEEEFKALGKELKSLEAEAVIQCFPCIGKLACAEFGLGFVRHDEGVTGGMTSTRRMNVAKEREIPQPPRRRVTAGAAGRPRKSLGTSD